MKIYPSLLEEWFRQHEARALHHLGSTMMSPFSLKELQEKFLISIPRETVVGYLPVNSQSSPLKETISTLYESSIKAEEILVTHGAIEANYLILTALIEPGDEVVLQWPIYPQLYEIPRMLGAKISYWPMVFDGRWRACLEDLEQLVSSKTRVIILNSPNNPTGFTYSQEEIKKILQIAEKHGSYVLSDEVYQGTLPGSKYAPLATIYLRGVSVNSLSKAFSLPGLRLGWLISKDQNLLQRAVELKEHLTICQGAMDQELARQVLEKKALIWIENQQAAQKNLAYFEKWQQGLGELLEDQTIKGALLAFPRFKKGRSEALALNLLREKGLFLVPGSLWGYPDHLRIGFGHRRQEELETALTILTEVLVNY